MSLVCGVLCCTPVVEDTESPILERRDSRVRWRCAKYSWELPT